MTDQSIDTSLVSGKQVLEMITVANEFCLFVEEIERVDKPYILEYLQRMLPLLYLKGSLLPLIDSEEESENDRYVSEETWEYVFNMCKNIFGDDNIYYFWNPDLKEPAENTVSENMADLYQDLRDFVFLYSKPSYYAKLNSVVMCRNLFIGRWGKNIPQLLNHLHGIIYDNEQKTENDEYE